MFNDDDDQTPKDGGMADLPEEIEANDDKDDDGSDSTI
jgi:hypothetical protein